jgi:RNA polymerase sigma-70 factor (TIGR02957 family)
MTSISNVQEFEELRPLLFSIGYRMLGSAAEAEDVVQDAWLRYSSAPREDVRSVKAYLTTIVTRLALDRLKSARSVREQYIGPWLPEPVLTEGQPEPEQSVLLAESLTLAYMTLLDTLAPEERAVFLLREVFEYSYAEIAAILNAGEASCRQLFLRAKQRISSGRLRFDRPREEKRKVAERFVHALLAGNREELSSVLANDVGFWGDGGGRVAAAKRPVLGKEPVLNLLLGIRRAAQAMGIAVEKISVDLTEANYEPAMVVRVDGMIDSVYVCSVVNEAIAGIRVVRNPDKLIYIAGQLKDIAGAGK